MDVMDIIFGILAVAGAIVVLVIFLILLLFVPNPFKRKSVIVSYRPDQYTALNADHWTYFLTVESSGLFGKRRREVIVNIPFSDSIRAYHEHWDQLIASKKPVQL